MPSSAGAAESAKELAAASTAPPVARRQWAGFVLHGLAWAGLAGALAALSRLTESGLFFRGVPPVPLRANPLLLPMSLSALVVFIGLAGLLHRRFPNTAGLIGVAFVGPIVLAGGSILAAIHPGLGAIVARDRVDVSYLPAPRTVFAVPVYFANASPTLSPLELSRIQDVFSTFQDCEAGTMMVRGFASSAPFKDNSDYKNRRLANDRAQAVAVALESLTKRSVTAFEWETHDQMLTARRVRDTGLNGERLVDLERINRRVEIFWTDSPCVGAAMDGQLFRASEPLQP